jgi:hypothetical protein
MIWVWILTAIVALLAISVAIFVVKELWQTLLVLVIGGIVITLILLIYHYLILKSKFKMGKKQKNIYGKNLEKCEPKDINPRSGSAMEDGTCSEIGGGFHQICVKNIGEGKSFSGKTGQSDWSKTRGEKSHCACLGAWANYVAATNNDKTLKCASIPETALKSEYVDNWKTWNQNTISGQAQKGIDELYKQCSKQDTDPKSQKYLRKLLCDLKKGGHISSDFC